MISEPRNARQKQCNAPIVIAHGTPGARSSSGSHAKTHFCAEPPAALIRIAATRASSASARNKFDQVDGGGFSGLNVRGVAATKLAAATVASSNGITEAFYEELSRNLAVNGVVALMALVHIMELACGLADAFVQEQDRFTAIECPHP